MNIISVIIPVYNAFDFIKNTINSVLKQSYKNYEIIVVDDGSIDNTKDVLRPFIKRKEIRYFYIKNSGVSSATNFGIKKSTGRYIAFLDHDDLFMPDKLKEVMEIFKYNNCDVVYHDAIRYDIDKNKRKFFKSPSIKTYTPFESILINVNIIISSSCVVVRKSCLYKVGLFDTNFKSKASVQDFDMWLKLAKAGYKFYHLKKYLTQYNFSRKRSASILKENRRIFINDLETVFKRYSKYLCKSRYIEAKANYFKSISNLLLDENKKESLLFFLKSLRYRFNFKFFSIYLMRFVKRLVSK